MLKLIAKSTIKSVSKLRSTSDKIDIFKDQFHISNDFAQVPNHKHKHVEKLAPHTFFKKVINSGATVLQRGDREPHFYC